MAAESSAGRSRIAASRAARAALDRKRRQCDHDAAEFERALQNTRREPRGNPAPPCRQGARSPQESVGKNNRAPSNSDGAERYYLTAEVTGDYEGLLRLAIGKNKAGGGHPQSALFSTIRAPQRVTKVGCRGTLWATLFQETGDLVTELPLG